MRDAIRFLEAAVPLRLLPMRWPLTVRVGFAFRGRGALCLCCLVAAVTVLVLVSAGGAATGDGGDARSMGWAGGRVGSATSMMLGIGVFRRVCRWCVSVVV